MDVTQEIIANGRVIRGWLGFSGGPINRAGREAFGDEVYLINGVSPGGPAELAGLKENDVILKVNQLPLGDIQDLQNLIAQSTPGSEIVLEILRQKQTIELKATVKERPQPGVTE